MSATASSPPTRGIDLDALAALEEQRAFLLQSLNDLDREHEVGDLDDDDYETLRADYTARAAEVLHAIENHQAVLDEALPTHRGARRVLLIGAVAVVALVAGLVVTATSGSRQADVATGGVELTPSKSTQACIADTTRAFAASAQGSANPNMVSDAIAAMQCYSARIKADPDDAAAYTYRGWTTALLAKQVSGQLPTDTVSSLVQRSRTDLAKARSLAPRYPDALVYTAISALWSDDVPTAKRLLAEIDGLQLPADSPILGQVNQMLRPALQAAERATTTTTTAPAGAEPGSPGGASS